jgi:predicted CXXCH cytochrome family protein
MRFAGLILIAALLPIQGAEEHSWLPTQGRPGGFVTSETCKSCHADEYHSWHGSFHRTMTQYAVEGAVKANFNNQKLKFRGETFELEKQGAEYWVKIGEDAPQGKSNDEKDPPVRLPIGMVTGFHHMQVFWLPAGAGNEQLGFPFTWLNEDQRWVPREATFLRDPTLLPPKEIWNLTCVRCHTTAPQPKPNQEGAEMRTRVAEMGIACEACHGPGEPHVAFQKQKSLVGGLVRKKPDTTIVQPERLEHDRASQICGQCHSMKYFDQKSGWLEHGFSYRPGDDLEATTPVMRPRKIEKQEFLKRAVEKTPGLLDDFFWKDGMIRVSGREYNGLIESPCYQRGKLSCLSCHSMHDSDPNDQLRKGMESNQACLQCHQNKTTDLKLHTHHADKSGGSECYNCHMPNTTYGLLKAMRSHEISNPNVSESVNAGRPNACNLCHLDKSLAWTAKYLQEWYRQNSPELSDEQKNVPAGVLWALKGDAGQRALAAWHFGWQPAQTASGSQWMAPFVAPLLNDSYAAVRYIAGRTVRSLPNFEKFDFDYVSEDGVRATAVKAVTKRWQGVSSQSKAKTPLSLEAIPTLVEKQDHRPVHLRE